MIKEKKWKYLGDFIRLSIEWWASGDDFSLLLLLRLATVGWPYKGIHVYPRICSARIYPSSRIYAHHQYPSRVRSSSVCPIKHLHHDPSAHRRDFGFVRLRWLWASRTGCFSNAFSLMISKRFECSIELIQIDKADNRMLWVISLRVDGRLCSSDWWLWC